MLLQVPTLDDKFPKRVAQAASGVWVFWFRAGRTAGFDGKCDTVLVFDDMVRSELAEDPGPSILGHVHAYIENY